MRTITLVTALLISAASFSQIAGTSFEDPELFSGKYTDTGDPNVAHNLINNPEEPRVNHTKDGEELGFKASYVPYDTPGVGSTDADYVGVTKTKPSSTVFYTDGANGYRMNDTDGNYILEFDPVDLSGVPTPAVSLDFLLSINSNPANGNYEGDGTINEAGSDRLRIYAKDLTNNVEIDLFNSTGSDLDDFVPYDPGEGKYKLEWQHVIANLSSNTTVQLIIEGRNNATSESFWFDNIEFLGAIGVGNLAAGQFGIYPNPATNGYINIISKMNGVKNVSIYDVLGTQVLNTKLNGERLDISDLNSGVYILKIEQGKASTTKKLVMK
ncbi:T9SS type A sorting domain-containing protein [Aequorivita capsosiphonis]|uniref:T9SS type A sorting domain-containing protein n=1 Tax=Aequorivita capsosiphonis TaxID=487317 RepID=UPI0004184C76|nr:T9SS type A sorting domain-containing protein [Aequorivita capsosiphonis]